jgi:UDPglucose 6-dehydrogenase
MLAVRVSFMNEIANLCEVVGANINEVRVGMGTDSRIGMSFLFPGIGYGGSCFPKDVQALIRTSKDNGITLRIPIAAEEVNKHQKTVMTRKVLDYFGPEGVKGKTIAVWGLAFKPKTDDVREAPALVVCSDLIAAGAELRAYDPEAMNTFHAKLGNAPRMTYCKDVYDSVQKADAIIICTEWKEFQNPNFNRIKQSMKSPVIFDGRNIFDPEEMKEHGFIYSSIGRPSVAG